MTKVYYADLFGSCQYKYDFLKSQDIFSINWQEVNPSSPFYLFIPQNTDLLTEYNQYWPINKIMPINSVGIVTGKDAETVAFSYKEAVNLCAKYQLENKVITPILYRIFDYRFITYDPQVVTRSRHEVMRNFVDQDNLGIVCTRQQSIQVAGNLVGVTNTIIESSYISNKTSEINYLFPLYIYPDTTNEQGNLFTTRSANFNPKFLAEITSKLGKIPSPESIFYYIYAIFHSSNYRQRYAEFLKIDFPHLPLISDKKLFDKLTQLGEELVKLHLMKSNKLDKFITKYEGEGDHLVSEVTYKPHKQRIYINKNQYFLGILPEIWGIKIGAYQVLDKWLKDRKKANINLSAEDILHYQKIVIALSETQKLIIEIDQTISEWLIINNWEHLK